MIRDTWYMSSAHPLEKSQVIHFVPKSGWDRRTGMYTSQWPLNVVISKLLIYWSSAIMVVCWWLLGISVGCPDSVGLTMLVYWIYASCIKTSNNKKTKDIYARHTHSLSGPRHLAMARLLEGSESESDSETRGGVLVLVLVWSRNGRGH